MAQSEGRLQFKGIPMEGSVKGFIKQLEVKKFEVLQEAEGYTMLEGTFAGRPNVLVIVCPISERNSDVGRVVAMIEAGDNWNDIKSSYASVVDLYKEKYGEPASHVEELEEDLLDGKLQLRRGMCDYHTVWDIDCGQIEVILQSVQLRSVLTEDYVAIMYSDSENEDQERKEMLEDI